MPGPTPVSIYYMLEYIWCTTNMLTMCAILLMQSLMSRVATFCLHSGEHQMELLDCVAAKFHEEPGVFKLLVCRPSVLHCVG